MSAYPPDFGDWPPENRNAFFAREAEAFREGRRANGGDGDVSRKKPQRAPAARARPSAIKRDLSNGSHPTIRLGAGDIERIVDESETALIRAKRGLYQRGNRIVAVGDAPAINADGQKILTQGIFERGEHGLLEDLAIAADFEKYDARAKGYVAADPPLTIVKTLRERIGKLRFPILTGVINAPTMRANGSILDKPGYDPSTGLLFDPLGDEFPPIPDRPTRDDAEKAYDLLGELIGSFPFVEEQDRAVAMSAILTACVRQSLPTAPLHAFTAPLAGSGKSKLVEIASTISRGRDAPVIAQGQNEEELEKRLASKLLDGASLIAIDNCEKPLGGDLLCMMLTQPIVSARILGKSRTPEMQTGAFITATGNNLLLVGDLTRRALVCRIDPKVECPENRVFDLEPVALARSNRARYVAAVLTVLRAFHVAGRPVKPSPLGSFEKWSNLIRAALLWMRAADPVLSIEEVKKSDPRRNELTSVIDQWRTVISSESVTVAQIIKRATETRMNFESSEFMHADFREALLAVAAQGGAINSKRLGHWLNAHKDRIVSGFFFQQMGTRQGAAVWSLRRTSCS